jgi:hypothetical protein
MILVKDYRDHKSGYLKDNQIRDKVQSGSKNVADTIKVIQSLKPWFAQHTDAIGTRKKDEELKAATEMTLNTLKSKGCPSRRLIINVPTIEALPTISNIANPIENKVSSQNRL